MLYLQLFYIMGVYLAGPDIASAFQVILVVFLGWFSTFCSLIFSQLFPCGLL